MFIEENIQKIEKDLKKIIEIEKKRQTENTYHYFNVDKNNGDIVILDLWKYDCVFEDSTNEIKTRDKFFFRPAWEQLMPIPVTKKLYKELCAKYGKRRIDKLKFKPNGMASVRLLTDKNLYPLDNMEVFFNLGRQSFFILLNDIEQKRNQEI